MVKKKVPVGEGTIYILRSFRRQRVADGSEGFWSVREMLLLGIFFFPKNSPEVNVCMPHKFAHISASSID